MRNNHSDQLSLILWRAKTKRRELNEELEKCPQHKFKYETTFKTPFSPEAHISHCLDPKHLETVHVYTLAGIKISDPSKVMLNDDGDPYMTFTVKGPMSRAQATLTIKSPLDIEMRVKQSKTDMTILFSVTPDNESTDLTVSLYTNSRTGAMILPVITGITYAEDSSYLRKTHHEIRKEKNSEGAKTQEICPFRVLYHHYALNFGDYLDRISSLKQDAPSAQSLKEKKPKDSCRHLTSQPHSKYSP